MRKLAIVREKELSASAGQFGGFVIWRWCDDGRIQFVERPDWHHWLTLFCYAWVFWSSFWLFQGLKPAAPMYVVSAIAASVFIFNLTLRLMRRHLVSIRTQVRGPGSYKDGRFVQEGEE